MMIGTNGVGSLAALGAAAILGGQALAAADFEGAVAPFLETHCVRCHGPEKKKGDFRIDELSRAVGVEDTPLWAEVVEKVSSGEMPPDDEDVLPTADEGAAVVEWLAAQIRDGEAARMAKRERVSFHRLTREEYVNSLRDLLGVQFDAEDPGGLSEDPEFHGFERLGSILSLSAGHLEKYFQAAETVLDEAYPDAEPKPFEGFQKAVDPEGLPSPYKEDLEARGLADKVRFEVWPQDKFRRGGPRGSLPAPGIYEVSVQFSGLRPEGGPAPRLMVYHEKLDRVLFESDIVAPEDAPVTVTFRAHLPAGGQSITMINDVPGPSNLPRSGRHGRKPFVSIVEGRIPWQLKLTDEAGKPLSPFLIFDSVSWRGPVVTDTERALRARYMPETDDPEPAHQALARFAEDAFRRPLHQGEIEKFLGIVAAERAAGETFRTAMKAGMLAILCSKSFLFLEEGSPDADRPGLDDWELASRLSYFLWATAPDAELRAAAASGQLAGGHGLRDQVRRMLADERAARFSESFARQWLHLRKVGMFAPDKELYPDYDQHLENSMVGETTAYFREMLDQNLPLHEFLDSDWTMANPRLARHYGIAEPDGDGFRRVALGPDANRGGILTQASILSLTSDGTRHRPVHRGVWVSEAIFAKSPPPPPANVDAIEPNPVDSPKATLREKLAAHTANPNCASCHRKIDPLGLAFENYDAIGRWRTVEHVPNGTGENPPVDASGTLPDGRPFAGADEFKQHLVGDIDAFAIAFTKKLATFGMRRPLTIDDQDELLAIAGEAKPGGYRLRDLVESFVVSDLFKKR
ncbi:DUF1592 domain-containing protein [soil metagenome]